MALVDIISGARNEKGIAEALPRLADLLRPADAGQRALLTEWLAGCYTADDLEAALARRGELRAGERIYLRSGHAVDAHGVGFHAPDSEQAGLLARAQFENLSEQHQHGNDGRRLEINRHRTIRATEGRRK